MARALPVATSSLSALLFAALPKCPACLILLLAPFGIKTSATGSFLLYVAVTLVAIPMAVLMVPACRGCSKKPLLLAAAGATVMVAGRFVVDNTAVMAGGVLLMFAAAVWTALLANRTARAEHCASRP